MKLTSLRPMIWSEQLEDTIAFYTHTLGFVCAEKNDGWGWACLCRDEVEIMVAKPNAHTPFEKPLFTGSFYFNTDDVNALWNALKDKVEPVYGLEEFEWGMREFAIRDNNGYLLQFGQDISGE